MHAAGGDRSRYQPVRSVLTPGAPGDAVALARAYAALPGVLRCYVADLDAIGGLAVQRRLLALLASSDGFGGPLLLDPGISTLAGLQRLDALPARLVVGLETLGSFSDLARLAAQVEVTFSLDLRNDVPMSRPGLQASAGSPDPVVLAEAAVAAGARELILLDVGRVGRGAGVNLDLLARLRRALPGLRLLAGGGVRGEGDLTDLADRGCDGVLVATALHRGTLALRAPAVDQSGTSEVR